MERRIVPGRVDSGTVDLPEELSEAHRLVAQHDDAALVAVVAAADAAAAELQGLLNHVNQCERELDRAQEAAAAGAYRLDLLLSVFREFAARAVQQSNTTRPTGPGRRRWFGSDRRRSSEVARVPVSEESTVGRLLGAPAAQPALGQPLLEPKPPPIEPALTHPPAVHQAHHQTNGDAGFRAVPPPE